MVFGLVLAALNLPPAVAASAEALVVRTNYNALVLYYNPHIWKDGQLVTVRDAYHCRDVDLLCAQFIALLKRASGGQVNFQVVARFELDEFPPDLDPAVPFSAENYDQFRREGYDLFNGSKADYPTIIADPRFQIVPRVEADAVDAVWIFAPDGTGFWETAMAGRGAYWINGAPYPEVECSRRFVLYGFGMASHQGVGFMCENTAHMIENIMGNRIAGGWPTPHRVTGWTTLNLANPTRRPLNRYLNDWEYFTTSDAVHWDARLVSPGHSQAGLSHFPPTACVNYGWSPIALGFEGSWEMELMRIYGGQWRLDGGTFSVEAGAGHKAILQGTHDLADTMGSYRVPVIVTDADIETSVRISGGESSAHAGLLLRCSRYATGENAVRGYYVGLNPGQGRIEIAHLADSYNRVADYSVTLPFDTYHNLRVSLRGPTIEVALGPATEPVLRFDGATNGIDGAVGLSTYGATASFTHLRVTPVIPNYAETWRTYPELGAIPRTLSPLEWRGDGQPFEDNDGFFAWWYEHLPKNPGTHEVRDPTTEQVLGRVLNSWWPYIFDINRFDTPFLPDVNIVTPPADRDPPAAPGNLRGVGDSAATARIEWDEAEDNVGVTRYEVYRDGKLLRETSLRSFLEESLAPNTAYAYHVKARDGSGNTSAPSEVIEVVTLDRNLQLINGGFDLGLTLPVRWLTGAFIPSAIFTWDESGTGREGTRCVRIEATALNDARWTQEITGLVPNGRYRLAGWIKGRDIVLEPGASVGANLGAMDSWVHSTPLLVGTFDWTPVHCDVWADAEGRLVVSCRLGFWGSLATGEAWFDDVTLEYAPVAPQPVTVWGLDFWKVYNVPDGMSEAVTIAAGGAHVLALMRNGSVLAWGSNWSGESMPPADLTNVISVAAGDSFSLAVNASGTVAGWGNNLYGQCQPPAEVTNALAVAAGSRFSMALLDNGTVVAWGGNDWGECDVPPALDRVVAIDAGDEFGLALRADGTVVAWGSFRDDDRNVYPAYVPLDGNDVVAIACGSSHALALHADGSVIAWGENELGQIQVPPGLKQVVAVAAGARHCIALRSDGSAVAWGANNHDQATVPGTLTNGFAVAGGTHFSLALIGHGPPAWTIPASEWAFASNAFGMGFQSRRGQPYFLLYRDRLGDPAWRLVRGVAATDSTCALSDPAPRSPCRFYVISTYPGER